jgi:hypothetical protein
MNASFGRGAVRRMSLAATRLPSKALLIAATTVAVSCVSAPAFAQQQVSAGYLTGVWKENQQCHGGEAMVFFANNTMSSNGSVAVNYTVSGPSQILMYGPGGSVPIETRPINQDKMVITFQNDATVLHRCGGRGNAYNAPVPHANAPLSAAYITGGWGHNGNCANPEVFSVGGQFRTSQGHPGTWALFGNTLRLTVNNGLAIDFFVQPNGQRNMTLTQNNNGEVSVYTRCF